MYQNYRDRDGFRRHRLYEGPCFFDKPSVTGTAFDWIFAGLVSLILHGNAWGLITGLDGYGFPTGIEWIPPEHVWVENDQKQPMNPLRTKVFVYGREMSWTWLDGKPPELFHVRAFTLPGRLEGLSLLRAFALTIMAGQEAQRYGTDWYRAGGFPPGTFRNKEIEIDPDQAAQIRAMLVASLRRREPLVYGRDWDYCCDAETEMLTRSGWKRHDQVAEGDECLSLNPQTGLSEWQPVSHLYTFDGPHDVIEMSSSSHSSVTTGRHRWPVVKRKTGAVGWTTTETMARDDRVVRAAPVVAPAEAKWADSLVELVAWLWTEGRIRPSGMAEIEQSWRVSPDNVARIRAALTDLLGAPAASLRPKSARMSWREDRHGGLTRFRLGAGAGKLLAVHAPGRVVRTSWLAELTRAQLELFIQVSVDADGGHRPNGARRITQGSRERLEAFQVACALAGYAGSIREARPGTWALEVDASTRCAPAQPEGKHAYSFNGIVWCPVTRHANWLARRRGTTYFTGNTPVTVPPSEAQFLDAMQLNACIIPGTKLMLADGALTRADAISAGDEIVSWDGTRLTRGIVSGVASMPPRPTLRVQTQCGRELVTTLNHPYWASHRPRAPGGRYSGTLDGNARWTRADELKAGDYVRVALDWDGGGNLDPETAWALGALTGDGGLTTPTIKFTSKDPELVDRLGDWCQAHGGGLKRVGNPGRPYDYRINPGPGAGPRPSRLRRELREWGVLGLGAESKRVPQCVMAGGLKAQAAFLSGYLDTDGTVVAETRPQPIVSWASVSRELLEDCQHLLMLLGVQSTVRFHEGAHDRMVTGRLRHARDIWTLIVCGRANVARLAGLLEPSHPVKAARLAAWRATEGRVNGARSDVRWTRVTAVEDAGVQVTLGIEVAGTHAHVTGGIVTHNTQIAALLNLPPDRLGGKKGDSLSYANQQDSQLQILEALRPWLVRLEHAFSDLLPRNRFVRFYTDALLKTDLATRVKIYETQRNIGLRTVDEIRELEDLPPFPGSVGDEPMPLQLMTALGQRAGALPKSMEQQVVFLMDRASDELVRLSKEHPELVAPPSGPPAQSPLAYAASMIAAHARSLAGDPGRGWDDDSLFLRQLGDRAMATMSPEYVGAWIPDPRDHFPAGASTGGADLGLCPQ